jgi:ribosomal protein L21E
MPDDVARAKGTLLKSRFRSAEKFEVKFGQRIRYQSFKEGDQVLVRNNPIENTVSINKKIMNRYMGPYRVVRETRGKAYVLMELSGAMLKSTVAAYRLIPYVKREQLDGWARLIEAWDQKKPEEMDGTESDSGTETEE